MHTARTALDGGFVFACEAKASIITTYIFKQLVLGQSSMEDILEISKEIGDSGFDVLDLKDDFPFLYSGYINTENRVAMGRHIMLSVSIKQDILNMFGGACVDVILSNKNDGTRRTMHVNALMKLKVRRMIILNISSITIIVAFALCFNISHTISSLQRLSLNYSLANQESMLVCSESCMKVKPCFSVSLLINPLHLLELALAILKKFLRSTGRYLMISGRTHKSKK